MYSEISDYFVIVNKTEWTNSGLNISFILVTNCWCSSFVFHLWRTSPEMALWIRFRTPSSPSSLISDVEFPPSSWQSRSWPTWHSSESDKLSELQQIKSSMLPFLYTYPLFIISSAKSAETFHPRSSSTCVWHFSYSIWCSCWTLGWLSTLTPSASASLQPSSCTTSCSSPSPGWVWKPFTSIWVSLKSSETSYRTTCWSSLWWDGVSSCRKPECQSCAWMAIWFPNEVLLFFFFQVFH